MNKSAIRLLLWALLAMGQAGAEQVGRQAQGLGRGSALEKKQFEEHGLSRPLRLISTSTFLPADAELTHNLSLHERPALRFLLKKKQAGKPQHKNRLENAAIRNPKEFAVDYELEDDAEVAIVIVRPGGEALRHYTIPPGHEGSRKGANRPILWDGRDHRGREATLAREAAADRYFAILSIQSARAKQPLIKVFPLHQKEP